MNITLSESKLQLFMFICAIEVLRLNDNMFEGAIPKFPANCSESCHGCFPYFNLAFCFSSVNPKITHGYVNFCLSIRNT
jgi:hypothetical protein